MKSRFGEARDRFDCSDDNYEQKSKIKTITALIGIIVIRTITVTLVVIISDVLSSANTRILIMIIINNDKCNIITTIIHNIYLTDYCDN